MEAVFLAGIVGLVTVIALLIYNLSMQFTIDELNTEIERISAEMRSLDEQVRCERNICQGIRQNVKNRDEEIEKLVVTKQSAIEFYEDKIASRDAQIISLETECDSLQGELTALKAKFIPKSIKRTWFGSRDE
jgi:chromosome segregation ATPase